jgi:hypothetical protein
MARLRHFAIVVRDLEKSAKFYDLGKDAEKENFERKFKDPDGIIFDISHKGWLGATG